MKNVSREFIENITNLTLQFIFQFNLTCKFADVDNYIIYQKWELYIGLDL